MTDGTISKALHKRNKWVLIITLTNVILGIAGMFSTNSPFSFQDLVRGGTVLAAYWTIAFILLYSLYRKKIWIEAFQYIITILLCVWSYFHFQYFPETSTYFYLFYILISVSFYHNYKVLLLASVFCIANGIYYSAFSDLEVYHLFYPASASYWLIVNCILLTGTIQVGVNLRSKIEQLYQEALQSKNYAEDLLDELKENMEVLTGFNKNLKGNIESVSEVSKEIVVAYSEMASEQPDETADENLARVEQQDQKIQEIKVHFRTLEDQLHKLHNWLKN